MREAENSGERWVINCPERHGTDRTGGKVLRQRWQGFKEAAENIMRIKIVFAVLAVSFFSAIAAYGVLSNKDVNLIRIAFQNGYVAALRLDIEQIQKLKNDNATMEKTVEAASDRYVKQVQDMNK